MPSTTTSFHALHTQKPGFLMPNCWDLGSALVLAAAGFKAIATTSAGIAFSLGKPDYFVGDPAMAVGRDETIIRASEIARAVSIPVNADLEDGFGAAPETVAETITMAAAQEIAGGNIEDVAAGADALYDEELAVERIAAAAEAAAPSGFVLTARCDAFLKGADNALETAIRRSNRFLEAGAACTFVPGPTDPDTVKTLITEINGPFNLVMGLGNSQGNAHDWIAMGVQRISVGGSIARAALGFIREAALELRDKGTVDYAKRQILQKDLNALFADEV